MKPILVLLVCLLSIISNGQELRPRIGFAMNTATFRNAVLDVDATFIPGFHTGIDFQIPITDEFGLMSELLFVQKGFRIDFTFDPTSSSSTGYSSLIEKIRVNYGDLLCLPMYRWQNLYFIAGPGVSYGLFGNTYYAVTDTNGQVTVRNGKILFNEDSQPAIGDRYLSQRFAFTAVGGVGITLWDLFLVDIRYQTSQTSYPYPAGVQTDNRNWYHSFQLTTALRITR